MKGNVPNCVVADVRSYDGIVNVYNHIKSLIIEDDYDVYNAAPIVLFEDIRNHRTVDLNRDYLSKERSMSYGEYVVDTIDEQIDDVGVCIVSFKMSVTDTQSAGMLSVIFKIDGYYWRIYEVYDDDDVPIVKLEKWHHFEDDIATLLNVNNNDDRLMLWNSISGEEIPNLNYGDTIEVFIEFASV